MFATYPVYKNVLIAVYMGLLYGGGLTILSDSTFLLLNLPEESNKELFDITQMGVASLIACFLYLSHLPTFHWSFLQDSLHQKRSNWKMSPSTLYWIGMLYPFLIQFATHTVYNPSSDLFLTKILYSIPTGIVLTGLTEVYGVFDTLRIEAIHDFQIRLGMSD